jgi:hypothetical protein
LKRYWKVTVRYGHVGKRKEVSIARYIETKFNENILDVVDLVSEMPGVKSRGVQSVHPIGPIEYEVGKLLEKDNFYLQKLMTFNPRTLEHITEGA